MDTLERGLDLVSNFVQAVEEAWDKGAEVPTGLTSDGWTVSAENKFLESVIRLKGHGMNFVFEITPLKDQLAPSQDHLTWWWACEKRYGKKEPDSAFLAEMLSETYRPER